MLNENYTYTIPPTWSAEDDIKYFTEQAGDGSPNLVQHAMERLAEARRWMDAFLTVLIKRFYPQSTNSAALTARLPADKKIEIVCAAVTDSNMEADLRGSILGGLAHLREAYEQEAVVVVKLVKNPESVWLTEISDVTDLFLWIQLELECWFGGCLPRFPEGLIGLVKEELLNAE
jgi:hypothetical protein